jgi:hypothetical protein
MYLGGGLAPYGQTVGRVLINTPWLANQENDLSIVLMDWINSKVQNTLTIPMTIEMGKHSSLFSQRISDREKRSLITLTPAEAARNQAAHGLDPQIPICLVCQFSRWGCSGHCKYCGLVNWSVWKYNYVLM